ncbi:MAG: restriction endonuclease [Lachnospiraceae bacterium]|nr:restriction endonuclease [Lachnospiraceae bacterium]
MQKHGYSNAIDFSSITAQQFEDLALDYINDIFSENDTEINPTRYVKDGGKDIIITHISKITNLKTWVECKNHKRNLGLAEIGKNVVLVISKKINKLIYISASSITETAQRDILNVGYKNNFEVLFLDGDNYKRELIHHPKLVKKYFNFQTELSLQKESEVSVTSFISEFEKGVDIYPEGTPFIYLERGNSFYFNILIKNHTNFCLDNISITADGINDDFYIVPQFEPITSVSQMSDCFYQLFCIYRGKDNTFKFPDYKITFIQNEIHKCNELKGICLSLENTLLIPLTGKKVTEFITNKWTRIVELIKRNYNQTLIIYGNSGTGKTRLMEEMISLSKQNLYFTKYIDCKNRNGANILRNILSFVLDIPFDNHMLQYSKQDIETIIRNEYGKKEYSDCLYELFIDNKLNDNSLFYITRALLHFIENPRFSKPHILFIDNVQECDEFILNVFMDLIDNMKNYSSQFAIVLSINIEVQSTIDSVDDFIDYCKGTENNSRSYCSTFSVDDFDEADTFLFARNLLGNLEQDDPIIDQFVSKAGHRPFEMLMLYKHLTENKILIKGKSLNIPSIDKYNDFLNCIPPKINNLISERINSLKNNTSIDIWNDCENIIKCILLFYNKFPAFLSDIITNTSHAKNVLIKGLLIKYEKESINLEFYHDTIYRYFLQKNEYNDIGNLGIKIINWINDNPDYELDNRDKIIFYCYFKTGQINKTIQYGLDLLQKYFDAFDFRSSYEISDILYALNKIDHSTLNYFRLCYIYAMSSWETVNAYKTLEIYNEIHSMLDEIDEKIPVDELCMYYREYINANSHAGLYYNIKGLLEEFENIPDIPKSYQFVVHNRYTVYYMRINEFFLAKEHGDIAYSIACELKDNFLISTACSDIAFNFLYNKNDFPNAKKYFLEAINSYKKCEDYTYFRLLEIYNQQAIVYFIDKQYDKAIQELNKSIRRSNKLKNMYMEAKALNYKGIMQSHLKEYSLAFKTWTFAIRINEKLGNYSSLICIYTNISSLFLLQEEYEKSYDASLKAIDLLHSENNPVAWSNNFNPLFYNYILCCMKFNLTDEINRVLEQYPQYGSFYKNIISTHDIRNYLIHEKMNYFGLEGYSFL